MAKVSVSKDYMCCCLFYHSDFTDFAHYGIYLKPGQDDSLQNAKKFASQNYFYDEVSVCDRYGNYYPIKK